MKVAAYQAPLLVGGSMEALGLIRDRVRWSETQGVDILCCPEAVLGGLADDAERSLDIAIDVESGQLEELLAPLASKSVTAIVGFTETAGDGRLYNSAAVFQAERLSASIASAIRRSGNLYTAQETAAPSSPSALFRLGS
jgi:predicted amidohydrolase